MILEVLSSPGLVFLVLLGTALGIAVGAIPGLTGAMLISLSLPLTFGMDGQSALAFLVAMYVGSVSGGLITATLPTSRSMTTKKFSQLRPCRGLSG